MLRGNTNPVCPKVLHTHGRSWTMDVLGCFTETPVSAIPTQSTFLSNEPGRMGGGMLGRVEVLIQHSGLFPSCSFPLRDSRVCRVQGALKWGLPLLFSGSCPTLPWDALTKNKIGEKGPLNEEQVTWKWVSECVNGVTGWMGWGGGTTAIFGRP